MELSEIWPPYQVKITTGDLELTIIRDEDLPGLVELVLDGIHDPELMPFSVAWTDDDPADIPANFVRYQWSTRSSLTPDKCSLDFAVRRGGELVGTQGFHTEYFRINRTGETGSWLGRRFHGQGIGTRMRRAICAFAFEELGAVEITSGAFVDNPASLGVSRKVGYLPNGTKRVARRGKAAMNQRLLLKPEHFIRGDDPIDFRGGAALRRFLGINDPSAA
jgi:RimJ/RimL family protein N-acetyltransferase